MVKLRLKRMGSKFNAFYRIVAADQRSSRDGKFIEEIGFYNPHTKEIRIDKDRKEYWLAQGAVPSETVKKLFTKEAKIGGKGEVVTLPVKPKKVKVTAPKVEEAPAPAETPAEAPAPAETPAEAPAEAPAPAETPAEEA